MKKNFLILEKRNVVSKKLEIGINKYISNEEYHKDREFLSSSVIKVLYHDVKKYEEEYINGNKELKKSASLDEGTAIHTKILEPELYDSQIVVYPEMKKLGHAYKNFELEHPNKLILSLSQSMKIEKMHKAFNNRAEAVSMINSCEKEFTICSEISGVKVKMRADAINVEQGFIADIKSTSYSSELEVFKENAYSQLLSYDISAALYTKIASQVYNKPFDFYYIVISKQDYVCNIYKASQQSLLNGNNKINKALEKLIYFQKNNKWPENSIKKNFSSSKYEILEI